VATILPFSPHGHPQRTAPPADARAEVIVFPRTDIRALARLADGGDIGLDHAIEAPGEKDPD
jgi:hypothetical protein